MTDRKYANCNIAGDGKLYIEGNGEAIKFKIIDMSASGVNIGTKAGLLEGGSVKLKIRLRAGAVDAYIDLDGKVSEANDKGYNIEFVGLSEDTKDEIDELMRNTCDI